MTSSARALTPVFPVNVEVLEGPSKGIRQVFQEPFWTIGRGPENRLIISNDIKVSRSHVQIRSMSGQLFARNMNPKNAMLVDGNLTVEAILKSGSYIQIGDTVIRLTFDAGAAATQSTVMQSIPRNPGVMPSASGGVASPSPMGHVGRPRPVHRSAEVPLFSHPRFRFYFAIVLVGLALMWLMSGTPAKRKVETIRDSVAVTADLGASESEIKRILDERKEFDTPQYRLAQAQYIRGFRDYQQGQYARAMEAFQSARAFYPKHELATKYWTLAKRKFDEQVQSFMVQGRRYHGKQNYRLCQSAFATVLMLIKDDKNAVYQEARQFHDECRLKAAEGM